jgi:hypothetical protein
MFWNSFSSSLGSAASTVPYAVAGLVLAVLVIIVGWFVGALLKRGTHTLLVALKVDEWTAEHGLAKAVGGVPLSLVAGSFVKWYTILIFLAEASKIVQFNTLQLMLHALAWYLPMLLQALLIVVFGLLVARFLRNKIEVTDFKKKKTIARVTEMVVVFLAVIIGANNAGINVSILETAFLIALSAFVIIVAIILGLNLGLSFRKEAKDFMADLKKDLE